MNEKQQPTQEDGFYKDCLTRKLQSLQLIIDNFGYAVLDSDWFDVYVNSSTSPDGYAGRVASFEKRSLLKMFEKEIDDFLKKNHLKMEHHRRKRTYTFKRLPFAHLPFIR